MKAAEIWKLILLLHISCIISSGCGGGQADGQPDLGLVKGTVSMDGKPLLGTMVIFSPEKGRPSMGATDSDGKYQMSYIGNTKGAKLGNHKISITTVQEEGSNDSGGGKFKETIPAKYNSKSTLTEVVKAGKNVIDFELTSKK